MNNIRIEVILEDMKFGIQESIHDFLSKRQEDIRKQIESKVSAVHINELISQNISSVIEETVARYFTGGVGFAYIRKMVEQRMEKELNEFLNKLLNKTTKPTKGGGDE